MKRKTTKGKITPEFSFSLPTVTFCNIFTYLHYNGIIAIVPLVCKLWKTASENPLSHETALSAKTSLGWMERDPNFNRFSCITSFGPTLGIIPVPFVPVLKLTKRLRSLGPLSIPTSGLSSEEWKEILSQNKDLSTLRIVLEDRDEALDYFSETQCYPNIKELILESGSDPYLTSTLILSIASCFPNIESLNLESLIPEDTDTSDDEDEEKQDGKKILKIHHFETVAKTWTKIQKITLAGCDQLFDDTVLIGPLFNAPTLTSLSLQNGNYNLNQLNKELSLKDSGCEWFFSTSLTTLEIQDGPSFWQSDKLSFLPSFANLNVLEFDSDDQFVTDDEIFRILSLNPCLQEITLPFGAPFIKEKLWQEINRSTLHSRNMLFSCRIANLSEEQDMVTKGDILSWLINFRMKLDQRFQMSIEGFEDRNFQICITPREHQFFILQELFDPVSSAIFKKQYQSKGTDFKKIIV